MTGRQNEKAKARIIACEAFHQLLTRLNLDDRFPGTEVIYLPAHLHQRPAELERLLSHELERAVTRFETRICLYGECFPTIGEVCTGRGAMKVPGWTCYEMLLGKRQYREVTSDTAGVYFVDRLLVEGFDRLVWTPLELFDREMRDYFLKHYRKLVYVRQPRDRDIIAEAEHIARLLDLRLDVRNADYSQLTKTLLGILGGRRAPTGDVRQIP